MTNQLFLILIITLLCLSNNLAKAETQAYVRYKVNPYSSSQQLGCSPTTPESIQNYMRNVYQRIESFANIPVKDSYGKIAVSFYLDINGKVSNLNITKSSGDFQSDRLAMEAVIKSAPFEPFPIGFNSNGMQFNFVFYLQPFTQSDNTQIRLFPNSSISSNPFIPEIKTNIKNNTNQTAQYDSNYYQSQNTNIFSPSSSNTYSDNNRLINPYVSDVMGSSFNDSFKNLTRGAELKYIRSPKNPMRYNYQPQYSDYIQTTYDYLLGNGILIEDYHFKNFPIKYWIQASSPHINRIIRESINEYANYFPMIETRNKFEADLTIEVGRIISDDYRTMGRAGFDCSTLKGNVNLDPKIFDQNHLILAKLTVKHEIAHGLGLIKHSNSADDIMYAMQRIDYSSGFNQAKSLDTGKIKTAEQFAQFSIRDLNTLWILYNQWF